MQALASEQLEEAEVAAEVKLRMIEDDAEAVQVMLKEEISALKKELKGIGAEGQAAAMETEALRRSLQMVEDEACSQKAACIAAEVGAILPSPDISTSAMNWQYLVCLDIQVKKCVP